MKSIKNKKHKNKKNINYIKRCIPYFLLEKKALIIFLITSILVSISSSFLPAVTGYILNYITSGDINKGLVLLIIVFIISSFSSLIDRMLDLSYIKLQTTVTETIRKDVIYAYYKINNKSLNKVSSGLFISRIMGDPDKIFQAFNSVRSNINILLSNFFVLFYMFYLNKILGLIVLIGTAAVYIVEKRGMKLYVMYRKNRRKIYEKNTGVINEGIKGIHDIKLLNLIDYFKVKISSDIDKLISADMKGWQNDINYIYLREMTIHIFTFVIVLIGIYFVKFDLMPVSSLIVIFMYRTQLFSSILRIAWTERNVKEFGLAASRIFDVIDGTKFEKETYGVKRINDLTGNIEFKNVKFAYEKNDVLKGVSFKINSKDTAAIVGRSGSGKTTIINLLTKSFTKQSGKILLDGVEIEELDKYTLRKNISVIPQSPYIFNMTIKENLRMVEPHASQKQLENVCKVCEMHDYIESLPKKYNTLLGEGGVNLSGGQRQRLAIARALLMKANIILFDEATSALDNETQASIQSAINNISSEYTMIIIAHRLSTIKNCNKIIVVDNGKVIGVGTHKELLSKNKVYKTLYENELEK